MDQFLTAASNTPPFSLSDTSRKHVDFDEGHSYFSTNTNTYCMHSPNTAQILLLYQLRPFRILQCVHGEKHKSHHPALTSTPAQTQE